MEADIDGLYIEVFPTGRKVFLLRLTLGNKRRKFTLGDYPAMSLRDARVACAAKRKELEKLSGTAAKEAAVFSDLVFEWFDTTLANSTEKYKTRMAGLIRARVLPRFEKQLAGCITSADILSRIRDIEAEGKNETAHRVFNIFNRVFNYGVSKTVIDVNPAASLGAVLVPVNTQHFASITEKEEVADLMKAISAYLRPKVKNALLFSAYTFCRPGEIRAAKWQEFDLSGALWRIPAEKMKMRRPHIVPLSRQALTVLSNQHRILAEYYSDIPSYVFPSERSAQRPMSADTVRLAIRAMGHGKDEMTAHGFRSMASTILNESGLWNSDAIERQLAHMPLDRIRETYNYAQYMPERIKLMQWYADYLDELKAWQ